VTQRGNDRQAVFASADDRRFYLECLRRQASRHGARILGYCLMTNHVHLVAGPERDDSLARALRCAHSEYALAFNRRHGRSGHLWQNRYFSCVLDRSHLLRALRYVELNPVRAGLAAEAWEWPWSSARAHTLAWAVDAALDPDWQDYIGLWNHAEWREILAAGMEAGECETVRRATNTGEPLGEKEFLAAMERETGRRLRVMPRGRPKTVNEAGPLGSQQSLFAASGIE
jgi:putative transposase